MIQRLPLISGLANYRFGTNLAGVEFVIDIRWNARDEAWFMDVMDEQAVPIAMGLKLVLGASPGIRSASAEFPPGVFVVSDLSGTGTEALFNDLGDRVVVDFLPYEDAGLEDWRSA